MDQSGKKIRVSERTYDQSSKSRRFYVSHHFKIVWVKDGSAIWNIAGYSRTVTKDDIVLLNNEEKRMLETIVSPELVFFTMEFEPQFLFNSELFFLFSERAEDGSCHRIVRSDAAIGGLLERVREEHRCGTPYSETIIASCVIYLLALAARQIGLTPRPRLKVNSRMSEVLAYIDERYTRRITLEELASIARMSPTGFSKYFTKYNGIGPSQYMKRKRIELAIRLLEETDRTILDIALECGFQNVSNFYKAFHSLTQHVPSDYRTVREE